MAWRAVAQPNGKYALYSDIVTHFTLYNMSREEAVECCFREIADGETSYLEQCRRLGVAPRMTDPNLDPSEREAEWRKAAEGKVLRAEQNPGRWLEELESIGHVHGAEGVRDAQNYDLDGRSHWPVWIAEQERTRRFKKGDRVIPKIRGTGMTIHEVLPSKWYVLANDAGPVGRWQDHELDPAPAPVQA